MPRVVFILVEAAVPENVGFSIRALKTMGFSEIRLVDCCDHLSRGTKKTAYGSHDLLEKVQVHDSLESAIEDIDLVIGTTAKSRVARHDQYDPVTLVDIIGRKEDALSSIAVVFGSEENGLSKEQLKRCDLVSTIPLQVDYPSLNLAQAVLVYAYELSKVHSPIEGKMEESNQARVKKKASEMLVKLGVERHPVLHQRLKDRLMSAGHEDIKLMLSLIKYIERRDLGLDN